MSKSTLALFVGGFLPAILFGMSSICQKTAARAGVGIGPYLITIGTIVLLAGITTTFVQSDTTTTREGVAWACGYAILWSFGISCVAIALARYDANISQLVPIYNLNTLVAIAIGLVALGEWREVVPWRIVVGAALAVAGGVLAATATR